MEKSKFIYGLAGNILKIDLSNRKIEKLKSFEFENGLIGGRGLNQNLLIDLLHDGISPFDEKNIIVLGVGRFVGSPIPGSVRMNIDSVNPFTGGIGSSNIGGRFGNKLKNAGFDNIIICGKSEKPVYIYINNESVEIRDAKSLWGKLICELDQELMSILGSSEYEFISIGPAGENRVWGSAIIDRYSRAAARCGLGAIMGDKGLKAIVVQSIKKDDLNWAYPERFFCLAKEITEKLKSLPSVKRKNKYGTLIAISILNKNGAIPVRNFDDDSLTEDELNYYLPERLEELLNGSVHSCTPCPINCQHSYKLHQNEKYPCNKLEANSILDFGPRLGITSIRDIIYCHTLCSQYGLDIDTTGAVVCWTIDCFEKGILTSSDTDGIKLQWGNSENIFKIIKKIAIREGIGDILSEGSLRASLKVGKGSQDFVFEIKGQDLIEPIRSCKGWALGVSVSPRGGTHTRGAPQTEFYRVNEDISRKIWDIETAGIPQIYEGKAKLVIYYERYHAVLDSLGLCYFISNWSSPELIGPKDIANLCTAAFGEEFSEETLMEKGEQILTLEKIFNLLHTNFSRNDDYPPNIFFKVPIKTGQFSGEKLEKEKWDKMLTEYYTLHGWNNKTGKPTKKRLEYLGFEKYANLLKKGKKID